MNPNNRRRKGQTKVYQSFSFSDKLSKLPKTICLGSKKTKNKCFAVTFSILVFVSPLGQRKFDLSLLMRLLATQQPLFELQKKSFSFLQARQKRNRNENCLRAKMRIFIIQTKILVAFNNRTYHYPRGKK